MSLSAVEVKNAKPGVKLRRLYDTGGLYLEITPKGGKRWRIKFYSGGKEKRLSLGTYPDVGLKEARKRRDELRRQVAEGIDPAAVRRAEKERRGGADSFEAVAREWHAKHKATWTPGHARTIMSRLERNLFPYLGSRPVGEITAPELLRALQRIEERGAVETAHRVKQIAGKVFRYALSTGRAERDPSIDLKDALRPVKPEHLPAITKPAEVGALLRAIDGFTGTPEVRAALHLLPLVFVRPGELRKAEWVEFDLEAATWEIPAERMKMKQPHVVPLSRQAVAILRELEPLTGRGHYVFPGGRTTARPMSENALTAALRRMGYAQGTMTAHGFRAMARTLLDEQLGFRVDYIEHQLAHEVRDPLGTAYNRTKHLKERRAMMQAWADYLDSLRAGANVIPLHGKRSA